MRDTTECERLRSLLAMADASIRRIVELGANLEKQIADIEERLTEVERQHEHDATYQMEQNERGE